jgi:spore photoproduct lyase
MNAPTVSRKFELGAPSFERRLRAAARAQKAGYPVRIRLDPIVPVQSWRELYAETIRRIFGAVSPERVTLGTLRFEPGFHKIRRKLVTTGEDLLGYMERMKPMFPRTNPGSTLLRFHVQSGAPLPSGGGSW